MIRTFYTFLFNLILISAITAQENKDCSDPLILCGESPFSIEVSQGVGIEDVIVSGSCVQQEFNSIWIELNIESSGDIIFDMFPHDEIADLDFIVIKKENDDCNNNEVIRCMASGETVGGGNNEQCGASTGLQYGEVDTEEQPGCSGDDNNFLAPLEVLEGEQYLLLINNFSNTSGFDLNFGGTGKIGCITTNTSELEPKPNFSIVSSNIVTDELHIQTGQHFEKGRLYLLDMNGKVIYQKKIQREELVEIKDLKISGTYIVIMLETEKGVTSDKVLFIN